jgi:lipoyl(octanoyl) transferase
MSIIESNLQVPKPGAALRMQDLGRMAYAPALALQRQVQASVIAARESKQPHMEILLVEHDPAVITISRRPGARQNLISTDAQLKAANVEIAETDRGGDITYHGPGQVVGYPIMDLRPDRCDVHRYVRDLEEVMIRSAADFGLSAGRIAGLSGAWVGADKLGAIGVRISRWITSHGFAYNVTTDLDFFSLIVPCGIRSGGVTSLSRATSMRVSIDEAADSLVRHFADVFGREVVEPARRSA